MLRESLINLSKSTQNYRLSQRVQLTVWRLSVCQFVQGPRPQGDRVGVNIPTCLLPTCWNSHKTNENTLIHQQYVAYAKLFITVKMNKNLLNWTPYFKKIFWCKVPHTDLAGAFILCFSHKIWEETPKIQNLEQNYATIWDIRRPSHQFSFASRKFGVQTLTQLNRKLRMQLYVSYCNIRTIHQHYLIRPSCLVAHLNQKYDKIRYDTLSQSSSHWPK